MCQSLSQAEVKVRLSTGRHKDNMTCTLSRHQKVFGIGSPMSPLLTQALTQIFRSPRTKVHVADCCCCSSLAKPSSAGVTVAKVRNLMRLWHNGQCTSDISFADVGEVDSPTAEALLGTMSFAQRRRTRDALSCDRKALLPIRGNADGPAIGVGVPSLP